MQQLTSNLYVETGIRGCNHGFVTTSDGVVMIDSPHKPSDALKLAPVITFRNGMTLHVGNHTFQMIHMPGHTAYQAAVCIKEEGVVFTSDNIFHKCHTWLQEANPDLWLVALESLRKLPEEILVPGHGPVCGKEYLNEQGAFIQEWKAYVKDAIERGMTKEEAIEKLTAMTDRYPMDIGQDGMAPGVMKRNVANLYDYLTGAWKPA
jgi:glyoxylase-like metal-dependent hydrolase (beta-lactamase superfamily II)